jgi:TatD DNase family protein
LLVDTHCHLDFSAFDQDRDVVLEAARSSGVDRILIPGIHLESSHNGITIAEEYENIYTATGVHPNDADRWDTDTYQRLFETAHHPKVVAIGEIGLDYYWDRVPKETQKSVFENQLEIAKEMNLPVVIHTRDPNDELLFAIKDAYSILKEWVSQLGKSKEYLSQHPGVLHSFSYDISWAEKFIDLNFKIGITGPVTFKKAERLSEIVNLVDLSCLLVETDSPFLAPHPFRGRRNQPAYVRLVVEKISEIRRIPFEEAASATSANARRLFSW